MLKTPGEDATPVGFGIFFALKSCHYGLISASITWASDGKISWLPHLCLQTTWINLGWNQRTRIFPNRPCKFRIREVNAFSCSLLTSCSLINVLILFNEKFEWGRVCALNIGPTCYSLSAVFSFFIIILARIQFRLKLVQNFYSCNERVNRLLLFNMQGVSG